MSKYTIQTTISLINSTHGLTNIATGDVIETLGYYASNDGGAGTFTVRAKETDETANDMFTYALGSSLIAELQIPNGTINVDQLGAKELLGTYATYEEFLGEDTSSMSMVNAYSNAMFQEMTQNNGANNLFHNGDIIQAALENPNIHTIRFSPNKSYGVGRKEGVDGTKPNPIQITRSGITIDGCGATIRGYFENDTVSNSVIQINQTSGASQLRNICIQNLHLHGLWRAGSAMNHVIRGQYIDNLTIRNIYAENGGYGFRISGTCQNIVLEHNHIEKTLTGIQLADQITGGHLTDSYISTDWNLLEENKGNHGIYAGAHINNYKFERLEILNAGKGNAINRHDDQGVSPICENLFFSEIRIKDCGNALYLGERIQNVIVQKVYAKNFTSAGIHFSGVDHVSLTDCIFKSASVQTGIGFETNSSNGLNSYVRHVIMKRCIFETHHAFFLTGKNHSMSGDSMRLEDCRFKIQSAVIGYRQAPGSIVGVIEHATFKHCDFEIENFASNQYSIGLFFYFDHKNLTDMHWHFDSCRFINRGTVTANSPIMVFNNGNHYDAEAEHIFITVRNCLIKGFRWLIRYGTASGLYHYIDPAFSGYPIDIDGGATPRQDAIDALNAVQHVLAYNNFYFDETIDNEYHLLRRAEEFGC